MHGKCLTLHIRDTWLDFKNQSDICCICSYHIWFFLDVISNYPTELTPLIWFCCKIPQYCLHFLLIIPTTWPVGSFSTCISLLFTNASSSSSTSPGNKHKKKHFFLAFHLSMTNSMKEKIPPWEAASHSAGQEFHCLYGRWRFFKKFTRTSIGSYPQPLESSPQSVRSTVILSHK